MYLHFVDEGGALDCRPAFAGEIPEGVLILAHNKREAAEIADRIDRPGAPSITPRGAYGARGIESISGVVTSCSWLAKDLYDEWILPLKMGWLKRKAEVNE